MLSYCNSVKIVMKGGSFMDLETLTDIPNAETIQAIHETEILLNTPNAKKYNSPDELFKELGI